MAKHGTRTRYNHGPAGGRQVSATAGPGCRCRSCSKANADYFQARDGGIADAKPRAERKPRTAAKPAQTRPEPRPEPARTRIEPRPEPATLVMSAPIGARPRAARPRGPVYYHASARRGQCQTWLASEAGPCSAAVDDPSDLSASHYMVSGGANTDGSGWYPSCRAHWEAIKGAYPDRAEVWAAVFAATAELG